MKNKKYYFIIILFGLLFTFILLGLNNVYGSNIDWLTQHSIIPNHFRELFYETGNLIPNLDLNIGAGQNIFNLSYYGLMNPIILLSYLFPFIKMNIYICIISIILYLLSGVLLFKFLDNKRIDKKVSLLLSLILLSLSPITLHFHYHIMFVWYIPFLLLSLIGVDKYIKENDSILMIISIFLLLLTNYYYGFTSIIVISIYGIYSLLKKKATFKEYLIAIIKVIIPILMACFILMPTIYTIINTGRINEFSISFSDLMLFKIKESMYHSYSSGISLIFISAIIGNIFSKNRKKEDLFLNIVLLLITFIPIIMYILNGFLYVRGKVLIPFIPLYIYSLATFLKKIINNNILLKQFVISLLIICLYILLTNLNSIYLIIFIVDMICCIISYLLFKKYKNSYCLLIPTLILFIIISYFYNKDSFLTKDNYKLYENEYEEITKINNSISYNGHFRTDVINKNKDMNIVYSNDYYSTTMYSSTYNNFYHNFYNNSISNNIPIRNTFVISGSNNPLFYSYMGVKYLIGKDLDMLNYEKVLTYDKFSIYYNRNAYPLIYLAKNTISYEDYNKLQYPYNLEYLMNYSIVNHSNNKPINTSFIRKIDLGLKDVYNFEIKNKTNYHLDLKEDIYNKYLIIRFNMNYNSTCSEGDSFININGVSNKLTCKEWFYHNNNNVFEYVISSNEVISGLDIEISKGKFNISDIQIYTMENINYSFNEVGNLYFNKSKSIISANVNSNNDNYVITSLPYDIGYKVYVDNNIIDSEIVNKAFLGFKIDKGNHEIKIFYKSPLYKEGIIVSILGSLLFILIIIKEKKISNL